MKKTTIYKFGVLFCTVLGASTFTAFDNDGDVNQGKIDIAYAEMVTAFNNEQMQICKDNALQQAIMQVEAQRANVVEGEPVAQPSTGGGTVTRPTTKSGSTGGSEVAPAAPTTTTQPTGPDYTNDKKNKMSGDGKASTEEKKNKMGTGTKSSTETTVDKKKSKMNRGNE